MVARIEFYAGNARAIASAVSEGEDPRRLKNTLGSVSLSFNLPPLTSIDQLVEAVNQVMGSELDSFEEAVAEGNLLDEAVSVDVVDSEWVRAFAELKDIPVDPVYDAWIKVMSEEEGMTIKPSAKLKPALAEFLKLIRKTVAQKAALIHVWSA